MFTNIKYLSGNIILLIWKNLIWISTIWIFYHFNVLSKLNQFCFHISIVSGWDRISASQSYVDHSGSRRFSSSEAKLLDGSLSGMLEMTFGVGRERLWRAESSGNPAALSHSPKRALQYCEVQEGCFLSNKLKQKHFDCLVFQCSLFI